MNAEEFTEKFWIDTYVYGEYSNFIKHYWKENDIDIGMQPGDAELMKSAKIDFIAVNCYRSNVAKYAPHDAKQQDYLLNKNGVKGQMVFPVEPGRYALTRNPYVETPTGIGRLTPPACAMRCVTCGITITCHDDHRERLRRP